MRFLAWLRIVSQPIFSCFCTFLEKHDKNLKLQSAKAQSHKTGGIFRSSANLSKNNASFLIWKQVCASYLKNFLNW